MRAQQIRREPIAIVGIGCRLPGGVTSPQKFWELLCHGIDAVGDVPPNRWQTRHTVSSKRGDASLRRGGFLQDLEGFDARFFGITPREAALMDPQQRLLLEVTWEAIEDAGIVPVDIAGSNSSVFIGISTQDYGMLQAASVDRASIDAYTNSGVGLCIAANRISYVLDLRGPSVAIDTACSSSLVAVHLACQSIWNEGQQLAIVGGVNALIRLESTIGFHRASMLSPQAKCMSFDADADGYVRSEGCAVIILRPLSIAVAARDPIYAVIRGTAVNQSGHGPGITVPSARAQEALLREAYRRAGVRVSAVDYIEAHGTGTPVGDPIEADAIGRAVGFRRSRNRPCVIGSVKSNIGHLEAAAGIAGLIKAALCVKHAEIPASLHFHSPNSNVDFDRLRLRVPEKLEPWPDRGGRPRIAGVNSFGFGGVNAHVVLEQPPTAAEDHAQGASQFGRELLLPISARSSSALQALAKSYLEISLDSNLAQLCYSAARRRGHHDQRLALVIRSREDLADSVNAFLNDERRTSMSCGRKSPGHPQRVTFVFSGMGPERSGMGLGLSNEPVWRESMEACDQCLHAHVEWSLLEELARPPDSSRIHDARIAQPAIFALQVSLAALWRSWGIEPSVIVGHSVGEVAAAHVAGVLSLEDAVGVIYHRSSLQHRTEGEGTLLAVGMPLRDAEALIASYDNGALSIAAINSPCSVTLSGERAPLNQIMGSLTADGIFCRFLSTDIPYHSCRMEPLMLELSRSLSSIQAHPAKIPLFSTVTGQVVAGTELEGSYWAENIRRTVRFSEALQRVAETGSTTFLEVSSHPVLAKSILECNKASDTVTVLSSLRNGEDDSRAMLGSLGRLYTLGFPVDWGRLYPDGGFICLPTNPWQHERFWFESEDEQQRRLQSAAHPLLGERTKSALPIWTSEIDIRHEHHYLGDHRIRGSVVFPGAAYVEMALGAAQAMWGDGTYILEDVEFLRLCLLPSGALKLQLVLDSSQVNFDIFSLPDKTKTNWTRHATGKMRRIAHSDGGRCIPPNVLGTQCTEQITKREYYDRCRAVGLEYGQAFQCIERIWRGNGEALAYLSLGEENTSEDDFVVHPSLLDAAFQSVLGAVCVPTQAGFGFLGLPVAVNRLRFYGVPFTACWVHARVREFNEASLKADLTILDDAGRAYLEVEGLTCQAVSEGLMASAPTDSHLYASEWELKPRSPSWFGGGRRDYLPSPDQILRHLQPDVQDLREDIERQRYEITLEPELRRWAVTYSLRALADLGWDFHSVARFSADTLCSQLPILPQYHRLIRRTLQMLGDEGILRNVQDEWEVVKLPDFDNIRKVEESSWFHISCYLAECILLRRCGERMADVLRGALDPLEVIFPNGSLSYAQHLYQDSPTYRQYNYLVGRAVAVALQQLPQGRFARILEVGGGTGGMTSYILPALRSKAVEYVFTDVSGIFVAQARQTYKDFSFVQYRSLDVEADPIAQGFESNSFDIVLASDVLHATRDLRQSVQHLKMLLGSNGLLILLEGTNSSFLPVMVFGLLKSWWGFNDERVAQNDPRITPEAWRDLLKSSGFASADVVSRLATGSEAAHSVILAQVPPVTENPGAVAPTPQYGSRGRWVIAADASGIGHMIAMWLKEQGEETILVFPAEEFVQHGPMEFGVRANSAEDWYFAMQHGSLPFRGVVHLWSLDIPDATEESIAFDVVRKLGCLSACSLLKAIGKFPTGSPPRIWFATRGAQRPVQDQESVSIWQSPLWGLGRVIMNEHPSVQCTLVDLDPQGSDGARWLMHELCSGAQENEIALRDDARYVHRFNHATLMQITPQNGHAGRSRESLQLEITSPGILDSVKARCVARLRPKPKEVEIEIHAAGLNFKDVMIATGTLPNSVFEAGYTGPKLGIECSGVVTAVGETVSHISVGQEVLACAPATMATHTRVDARFVLPKPRQLTFEEAAGIPVAFSTAHYALHHLARLQKGERILIHAAAGGVGLAAVQLAKRIGADVFATAGSPDKRELLRAVGVGYVSDSRSLEFADEIMQWTDGRGVDVVLNSLAGEAIAKGISVLAPYGRFIEIGKYDIYANNKLALKPFCKNVSFIAVDVDRLMSERPDTAAAVAREVAEYFAAGELYPLPYRVFSAARLGEALRYMAQAKHIGKVVVSLRDIRDVPAVPENQTISDYSFRADGTYLVTGGLGGFGLATAQWLAARGARHIVLTGRSGASSLEAQDKVKELRASGVNVSVVAADVAQIDNVRQVLRAIEQSMPPLRGIFHAAMVLEDTLITGMDDSRLTSVMSPKICGAWNLHILTSQMQLDCFVLFSSMSSLFGTPSQGNYAAANSFLDSLAWYRSKLGLPACTVNWGVVADVGHVAKHPEIARVLENQLGATGSPAAELLDRLGDLLSVSAIQASIVRLDWNHVSTAMQSVRSSPRFSNLVAEMRLGADRESKSSIIGRLAGVPPEERKKILSTHVLKEIALIMGTSLSSLDVDQPMINLGIDSLMAIELKNRVEIDFGIQLNATQFLAGLTLSGMIDLLYEHATACLLLPGITPLSPDPPNEASPLEVIKSAPDEAITVNSQSIVENLGEFSDGEIDSLLRSAIRGV
jgi:acyl transferase domain-containing protein/NADPH:quinone reductase-like Zn-dependent oxidoreductase/SAM-dependent methyltransferase/acyl carrier protein